MYFIGVLLCSGFCFSERGTFNGVTWEIQPHRASDVNMERANLPLAAR
jgi:hypothetical protein